MLWTHDVPCSDQGHGNHDGVRISRRQASRACFSGEKVRWFLAFCARPFGKNPEGLAVVKYAGGTGQGIASTGFSMGFDLSSCSHHETGLGIAKMAVFGQVVCGSAGGRNNGNRVHVGEMVGCDDGGPPPRDSTSTGDVPTK